jgi:aromatic ring-opening dioxygenase LigB subunit
VGGVRLAYVMLNAFKLGPITTKCVFSDYASKNKVYYFLELDSNISLKFLKMKRILKLENPKE